MTDGFTQLGISGLTLAILFFVVRYFVQAMTIKDKENAELTGKFIDMTRHNLESQSNLTRAIEANTISTKVSTDNLSKLMLKVLKQNGHK